MRKEFSKLMIIADYIFMVALIIISCINSEVSSIAIAWTAQLGVSTGFYYWKSKNENRLKIPIEILRNLEEEERALVDLTQVITTLIDKD